MDTETERLYVADAGNNRINVFEADGTFLFALGWGVDTGAAKFETCTTASGCQAGIEGSGNGQFSRAREIVVDNDPASASRHDIYVYDSGNYRVQKFHASGEFVGKVGKKGTGPGEFNNSGGPLAIGPGGVLYVGDSLDLEGFEIGEPRIKKFDSSLAFLEECEPAHNSVFNGGLAVDSAGNFYASFNDAGIFKFKPDCSEFGAPYPLPGLPRALAVDAADRLYEVHGFPRVIKTGSFFGTTQALTKYDSAGNPLRRFGYGSWVTAVLGIATLDTAFGDVLTGEEFNTSHSKGPAVKYLTEPPPGPVVGEIAASPVGNVRATLNAEINPEGKATEYRFDYVDEQSFESEGGFASPNAKSTPLTALPGEADFDLHLAAAEIGCPDPVAEVGEGKCLSPETTYRYRVVFSNADGTGNGPREGSFETTTSLEFGATWSTDVDTDTATLHTQVNPLGIPTTGHFEYLTAAAYQANIGAEDPPFSGASRAPASPVELDFGSGETLVHASAPLSSLAPGTTYRYRILADDPLISPIGGPVRTFATFPEAAEPNGSCENKALRKGVSALLPDCRAYELVSPLDKEGEDVAVDQGERLDQSATSGDSLTYTSTGAPGPLAYAQHTATRGAEGWTGKLISPAAEGSAFSLPPESPFATFSDDLAESWLRTATEPVLAAGAIAGYDNLYRRDNGAGTYEACTTAKPPSAAAGQYAPQVQGVATDASHEAIFAAPDKLTANAAPSGGEAGQKRQLYDCKGGKLSLVSVLPDQSPSGLWNTVGTANNTETQARSATLAGAVSTDASHVYWTASTGESGPGSLYLRLNPDQPESARQFGAATGTGNLIGPAFGVGNLIKSSTTINGVLVSKGAFAVGQAISGEGIAAGTTITTVETGKLKLSKAATLSKTGTELTGVASEVVSGVVTGTGAFAVGQAISGGGIAAGTTITTVETGKLKLSALATETKTAAPLSATSLCTEAATKACTLAVSTGTSARFWAATPDGAAALFSAGEDLYRYDASEAKATLLAAKVKGVLGTSADLSRVYLLSTEALGGKGSAGEPNLYLSEGGGFEFVATLSARDAETGTAQLSPVNPRPNLHTARVSADGQALAFTSDSGPLAQLVSGYDNADAESGKETAEIYRYDASSEELECISCTRSGARPHGREVGGLNAAALIPTAQTSLYPGRPLSADGSRLFFHSFTPLLPLDTNGKADVYEWELAGTGDCQEGSPSFSPPNGGCIALISSGKAAADSEFIDASPEGDDVFFATAESLLAKDPGEADLYDARVNGGFAADIVKFALTAKKTGTGTGIVTSEPAGIDCGSTCSAEYPEGEAVTLTAKADAGSTFEGFSGACTGAGPCEVTMDEAREVTAAFAKEAGTPTHKLTLATEGGGSGTVSSDKGAISCSPFCEDDYEEGTQVTLTATPAPGSVFYSWKRCDSGGVNGRQCTVSMSKAKTVTAVFATTNSFTLTKEGGLGKVQSFPGGILCLANCSETTASFLEAAKVTLKATPAKRFALKEWTGDCTGAGSCELTMGEDHEVGALFAEVPKHILTLTKTGGGAGTVKSDPAGINCGATCAAQSSSFYEGDLIVLTSTPGKGSAFAGWSGGGCTGKGSCEVTISTATEVKAEFK